MVELALDAIPEACLWGPNGRRDRNERNVGMPVGVFGVGGDIVDIEEVFGLPLTLLVDARRAEGIEEGKALRSGCDGENTMAKW